MKWFDKWLYGKIRDMWENKQNYEEDRSYKMASGMAIPKSLSIDRGAAEGDDRITFELTAAVGGRILNVRKYDPRRDHHETTTYVIPTGEDVGSRVAKILNLELLK